ncbi:MAG: BamA/TamA family outer membrane protein [bacterium]|nr:BamA/TamA family outer membrane protein [bacterium]
MANLDEKTQRDPGKRKRFRRLVVLLAILLALPLLVAGALLVALRSEPARRATLDRAGTTLEEATGIRATATDFSLNTAAGILEAYELTLARGDHAPFLRAERVRLEFDWGALFDDPLVLRSLLVEQPVLDLSKPLPELDGGDDDVPERGFEIGRLQLTGGRLRGMRPATDGTEPWLREWSVGGIDLHGSLRDGHAEVELGNASLRLLRAQAPPDAAAIELELTARLSGPTAGPYLLESLDMKGRGLQLTASGELGAGTDDPLALRLDIELEPAELVPDLAAGGRLTARGDLDLRSWIGEIHLEAQDFPSAALEAWIGEAARPGGAASTLDLSADLASDPEAAQQVTGEADLVWRQGDAVLLEAAVTVTDGKVEEETGIKLESLAGRIRAVARDLPADFLRPWIGGETLETLGGRGSRLDLVAELAVAADRLEDPTGRAELVWHRGGERLLEAAAQVVDGDAALGLEFTASLLPEAAGERRLTGELAAASWPQIGAGELRRTRLALEIPDLAAAARDGRRLWPRILDEASAQWPLEGGLSATAEIHGPLAAPEVALDATWQDGERSRLVLSATGQPLAQQGSGRLVIERLDLAPFVPEARGTVSGVLGFSGSPQAWEANGVLDAAALGYGPELPAIDEVHLEAVTDGRRLRLTTLSGVLGESRFSARGACDLAPPIGRAELALDVERPFTGIERADLKAELADGVLRLARLEVLSPAGRGQLTADLPLGALRSVPELGETMADWPVEMADGAVTVDLDFPHVDVAALLRDLGQESSWSIHETALSGRLTLDPAELAAARGELVFARWILEAEGHRLAVEEPFRLELGDGRLRLHPLQAQISGRPFDVEATVELEGGWQPSDEPMALVRDLALRAVGTVDVAMLNPYLEGGIADGPVDIVIEAAGSPDRLTADVRLTGPEASILFPSPYVTELGAPQIELAIADGELVLRPSRADLNEGTLDVDGRRSREGDLTLDVGLDRVRYRVDYGLSVVLNGSLRLFLPVEGRGRLEGVIEIEHGLLRRRLDLEREILGVLLAPAEVTGTEADPLEEIDLDVVVITADGVRVKNNVADLRAVWSSIEVGGTPALPTLRGRIDVEPGGLIFAYGQTTRIDQGTIILTGDPAAAPELEFTTTTSLEDVTVGEGDPFAWQSSVDAALAQSEVKADEALAAGLADYLGGRLTERLSGALGSTRLSAGHLLVFNETDPGARLTVSRDLSSSVAFAASFDLHDSQNRTYLLDLHDVRGVPQLTAQLFTNDAGNQGVTLQQTLELGGGDVRDDSQPRLRKVFFSVPEEFSKRRLRRAVGFARGDRLPAGAAFDVEVDCADFLRRRGYPGARVDVEVVPSKRGEADLRIAIDPGPGVIFEFTGEELPVALRRLVTSPYRVDFYEQASLEEVRQEAIRSLRSQGYLDPRVEVTVELPAAEDPQASRTVTIHSQGGRRVRLKELTFEGIEAADAAGLAVRLGEPAVRVELAAALPAADDRLLGLLRSLGYPEARIASRRISDDGERLTVELDPGERRQLAAVRILGLGEADAADLLARLPVGAGDPPRAAKIAAAGLLIRDELERRGHATVQVKSILQPLPDEPTRLSLDFEVDPGPQYRIAAVDFTGLRFTRPSWALGVAGLGEDSVLDPTRLGQARRQLFGTGLFRSVRATTTRSPEGLATITFDLEEEPRFRVGYGVRWESEEGESVVVDAVDRNFLGRGVTLGLRGLYAADDRAARLYLARSNLFGGRTALEIFFEQRHEVRREEFFGIELVSTIDSFEGTLQLAFPLGPTTSRIYARVREELFESEFLLGEIRTSSPFVGWQLLYDRRDDEVVPTRGWFASTDLSATGDYLGSDFNFVRLFGQVLYFRSAGRIGGLPLTWAQSYRVGLFESTDEEPLRQELFFAGGEYSVRGYPIESLGPQDFIFGPAGGQALLVLNQELRFPVWREISGLVFLDLGNVWAEKGDFGSDLFKSVGFGVRATTPLGLARFDFAYPLDAREDDPSYKIYLGFGHAF